MQTNHLVDRILQCYTKTNKLSFNKMDSVLITDIVNATDFLYIDASISERVYCIRNNINSKQLCNITGDPLKFNPSTQQYNPSKAMSVKNRTQSNNGVIKMVQNQIKNKLHSLYISETYTKYSKQQIIDLIDGISSGNNITPYIIRKNYDLFCNILDVTKFLDSNCNWGERIYCIKHNITNTPVDLRGYNLKYINSVTGYSQFGKGNSTNIKRDVIISGIEKQGFKFLKFNCSDNNKLHSVDVKCMDCGEIKTTLANCGHWQNIYCQTCYGVVGRSKVEEDICRILESYNIELVKNSKQIIPPKELDIFIPSHNTAIEVNGVLWHSIGTTYPNNIDRETILNKSAKDKHNSCLSKGIQLLTIQDNEWYNKREVVVSIILAKLGIFTTKLYARKCSMERITTSDANAFYDNNHLQGSCKQIKDSFCLKFNGDIVCCMSFGYRKITKGVMQYELIRFCTRKHTIVVGGGSKLFKHALMVVNPPSVLSYCDKRYGGKNFYESLGFKLKSESPPNYWYTKDCNKLLHRSNFQKHKISTDTNKHLTEKEIMYSQGYRRIYDCGNYVFEYTQQITIYHINNINNSYGIN